MRTPPVPKVMREPRSAGRSETTRISWASWTRKARQGWVLRRALVRCEAAVSDRSGGDQRRGRALRSSGCAVRQVVAEIPNGSGSSASLFAYSSRQKRYRTLGAENQIFLNFSHSGCRAAVQKFESKPSMSRKPSIAQSSSERLSD